MEPDQYSITIVILTGAALLIVGVVLGLVLGRRSSAAAQELRNALLTT